MSTAGELENAFDFTGTTVKEEPSSISPFVAEPLKILLKTKPK